MTATSAQQPKEKLWVSFPGVVPRRGVGRVANAIALANAKVP